MCWSSAIQKFSDMQKVKHIQEGSVSHIQVLFCPNAQAARCHTLVEHHANALQTIHMTES